jgi:hypothetical protein
MDFRDIDSSVDEERRIEILKYGYCRRTGMRMYGYKAYEICGDTV